MNIKDLFDVSYGTNLELYKCKQTSDPDGINFVSRSSKNNGISARIERVKNKEPSPAGVLSCAAGGSVLSTFVQTKPFYSGRDLYVLTPKKEMSLKEKLFYCMCIKNNAYKYDYGRQANKTLECIELPNDIPDWVYKTKIEPIKTKNLQNTHSLNTKEWKEFRLESLFAVKRGKRLIKKDRIKGDIPFATAGKYDEGIAEKIGNANLEIFQDKITIDMFCNAFFRGYDFACDDNILVLIEKESTTINKYIGLFIAAIINCDRYKYVYGRQYRQKNFLTHIIKLPVVDSSSIPDWQYMENYIKSSPFADKI